MPSVSIITICYNCRNHISETVNSVREQTYDDIEYIVIDGDSNDGTTEWLKERRDWFDLLISEPDDGRYDAMNKGLMQANGDYVMFLNAGDHLRNPRVIEEVLTNSDVVADRPTIISGRIELMLGGESLNLRRPWKSGKEGPGLPHPATMVDRRVHQEHPFNDKYRFCGDYELWARLRNEGLYDVQYVNDVITLFDVEGASNSPEVAFARYLERAFVDYQYTGEFTATDATTILLAPLLRQFLSTVLGQRRFIELLRYRRLAKRLIRELSKL